MKRAVAALILLALSGCSTDNASTTTTSTTASVDGYEIRSVVPPGADLELITTAEPNQLEVGTYFGSSCSRLPEELTVSVERSDQGLRLLIDSMEVGVPTDGNRVCAEVAQRISKRVPIGESDEGKPVFVELGGQRNEFRFAGGRLETVSTVNVQLVTD